MNEKSEDIKELVKALCAAQADIHHAAKDSRNPHYGNTYASLASCIDATRAGLAKHGLAVIQTTQASNGSVVLRTQLAHISGQWVSGTYPVDPEKKSPQGYGSSLSYARRYSLLAILNLAQEDDDANEGSGKEKKPEVINVKGDLRDEFEKTRASFAKAQQNKAEAEKSFGLPRLSDIDAGAYTVTFGKHRGKTLSEIGAGPLLHYLEYVQNKIAEEGKEPARSVTQFIERAEYFLKNLKNETKTEEQIQGPTH